VPLPWRCDVNEVEVVARDESLEVSFAVCVNAGRLLSDFLDHLRRARAFVFYDVTDGVYHDLVDGEKFSEDLGAAQADADDSEADDVVRFEVDADHGSVLRVTKLRFFTLVRINHARGRQANACESGCF